MEGSEDWQVRSETGMSWWWGEKMVGPGSSFFDMLFPFMCAIEHYFCPRPQEHRVSWWKPFLDILNHFYLFLNNYRLSVFCLSFALRCGHWSRGWPEGQCPQRTLTWLSDLDSWCKNQRVPACLSEVLQPLLQTDFLWALLSFRNTLLYLNHSSGSSHFQKNWLFPMYEKVNSESCYTSHLEFGPHLPELQTDT